METSDYSPSESGLFEIQALHRVVRDIPKPVIAAVNGVAVDRGHVLHVICDLTLAAEHATFGQVGPRVGSFDAGLRTAYLARVIGEKRARQMWYLRELHSADTAESWGLVNKVVPGDQLPGEVRHWADFMLAKSPTALKVLKHSFNADSEAIAGIGSMAWDTLDLFVGSAEAGEGFAAFHDKRPPSFVPFRSAAGTGPARSDP